MFDEAHKKFKGVVRFGVVEVLHHHNLIHYLPYKFQYYPNIISIQQGEDSELFPSLERFTVASNT